MQESKHYSKAPLTEAIIDEIDTLRVWETDSYGCPAPGSDTLRRAISWITRLYFQVAFGNWLSPNITTSSESELVFEWWQGVKKLTMYVSNQTTEYIQAWGTNISS